VLSLLANRVGNVSAHPVSVLLQNHVERYVNAVLLALALALKLT